MTVRQATADDAAELARLRLLMFDDMGVAYGPDMLERCADGYRDRLGTADFASFVVDAPVGLAAGGAGWLTLRLPDPRTRTAYRGYVASMCTDPAHRRQGHARAILAALLGWFAGQDVELVELQATEEGAPLYASAGFEPVTTAWRLPSASRTAISPPTSTAATDETSDPSGRTARA